MDNNKPRKNKHVKAWMTQHVNDHFVHMAQTNGYRSRAAFKLLEIDQTENLFKNVKTVVDLGCAPGSWSQVAMEQVGSKGRVIGVDLLEIKPLHGLHFIQGDFTTDETLNELVNMLESTYVDLVISDMAPNISGVKNVDQARISYLVELVLDFCSNHLKNGGNCLIKVFNGGEFDSVIKQAREIFGKVAVKKPASSRSNSSETFLFCSNKKPS